MRDEISLPTRPVLSHSADAVRADELLFVAGILPVDANGTLIAEDDVAEQARCVFSDLDRILTAGGSSGSHLAHVNVYLTSIEDFRVLHGPLQQTCGPALTSGTIVEVRGLAIAGARIEIDAVAVRPS
ncbi:MAG: RidA family protein [Thermoleophilia bacterium]|nr:RidA family protein [Thermoleophilia bacterium]